MRVSVDFKVYPAGREVYEMLEPQDCVLKHGWLFRNYGVEWPRAELQDPDFDIHQYEERIELQRASALRRNLFRAGSERVDKVMPVVEKDNA